METSITQPQVTPMQELEQLRSGRADGTINDWDWSNGMQARFEQLAEKAVTTPVAAPSLSSQQASNQLNAFRMKYVAGEITQREFMAQMDVLGPLAAGEQPGVPQPYVTIDQQLRAGIDAQMAGAQPQDYEFESSSGHQMTDDELAWDSEVRAAFSAGGIPQMFGGPIHEAVDQVMAKLGEAPPEVRGARIHEVTGTLQQQWGADFNARIDAIDELIFNATENYPQVAEAVYTMPWLLADVRVMQWLDTVAQHQIQKRS